MSGLSANTGEMLLVVNGGDAFAQRLADLKGAKADAEKAFQDLKIGNDAGKAYDEGAALKAQYEAKIAGANAQAAAIIADGHAQADQLTKDAVDLVAQAKAQAEQILLDATAKAAKIQSTANDAAIAAHNAKAQADADVANAAQTHNDALAMQAEAATAERDHTLAKQKYDDLVAKITTALKEI